MKVTSIQFLDITYDKISTCHAAAVFFLFESNKVTLFCHSTLEKKAALADVIKSLLADAKRQILRMPEYRNGTQLLLFPPESEIQTPNPPRDMKRS